MSTLSRLGLLVQIIIYIIAIGIYMNAFMTIFSRPLIREGLTGNHWQFLTNLSLVTSLATQSLGLTETLHEFIGLGFTASKLRLFKLFTSYVSAPLEFVVGIMFWTLFTVDPAMLIDPEISDIFPPWLNYSVHAYPMFFELSNLFFCSLPWTIDVLTYIGFVSSLGFGYIAWMHYGKSLYGFYPYPFLTHLTAGQWIILTLISITLAVSVALILKSSQKIWLKYWMAVDQPTNDQKKELSNAKNKRKVK